MSNRTQSESESSGKYSDTLDEDDKDIDYYSVADSSSFNTDYFYMINQLHDKLKELDSKHNSLNSKNVDEITNLKSLVHSFVKLNDKNKFNDELDTLKADFKKLYSEYHRTVDANKSLYETLRKELSLLSSTVSKNTLKLKDIAEEGGNEPSLLESRVKELHSDILLEVGDMIEQKLSLINGLCDLSQLSGFNERDEDVVQDDIVDQSTNASSNHTSSTDDPLTSRTSKSKFNDLEDKVYTEISELRESFEDIYNNIGNNKERIAYLINKVDDFSSNFNAGEYKLLLEKFDILSDKIANYDGKFKSNQDSFVKCTENLNKFYAALTECSDSTALLKANLEDLSHKFIDLESNLAGDVHELAKSVDSKNALLEDYQYSIDQLQSQINVNKSLISNFPTKSEFDSVSNKIRDLELNHNNNSILFNDVDKRLTDIDQGYERRVASLENSVHSFSNIQSDLESKLDSRVNALRGDLSLEFHDKVLSGLDAKLGSATNDLVDQFDIKLKLARNELNESLDNKLKALHEEIEKVAESLRNEIKEKVELAARPSDTVCSQTDLNALFEAVADIRNNVIPNFTISVNNILESGIGSISRDLIHISVEKIVYEILDKLEDRIESLKGVKDTLPLPPEVYELTIQQKPQLFKLSDGSSSRDEYVEGLENKVVELSGQVQTLSGELFELKHSIHQIQVQSSHVDDKFNQLCKREARTMELLTRLQENFNQMDSKFAGVKDTDKYKRDSGVGTGTVVKDRLPDMINTLGDAEDGFWYEHEVVRVDNPSSVNKSACVLLNDYDIDYNYTLHSNAPSYGSTIRPSVSKSPTRTPSQSPVLERYIVPLSDSQVTVTRQYLDLTGDHDNGN